MATVSLFRFLGSDGVDIAARRPTRASRWLRGGRLLPSEAVSQRFGCVVVRAFAVRFALSGVVVVWVVVRRIGPVGPSGPLSGPCGCYLMPVELQ
jgi:hypothetical protein